MTPSEIRAWRDRMGWTQEELAAALSAGREPPISAVTVGRWERGEATPQPYLLLALRWLEAIREKAEREETE